MTELRSDRTTDDELLAAGGAYHALYRSQFAGAAADVDVLEAQRHGLVVDTGSGSTLRQRCLLRCGRRRSGTRRVDAFVMLGVPYALALGVFVSIAAVIPYLGAWLSAIPAVAVAITPESPSTSSRSMLMTTTAAPVFDLCGDLPVGTAQRPRQRRSDGRQDDPGEALEARCPERCRRFERCPSDLRKGLLERIDHERQRVNDRSDH